MSKKKRRLRRSESPTNGRGRPATRVMPELIPDSAANVVKALSQGPPKKTWDFAQPGGAGYVREGGPTRRADLNPIIEEY